MRGRPSAAVPAREIDVKKTWSAAALLITAASLGLTGCGSSAIPTPVPSTSDTAAVTATGDGSTSPLGSPADLAALDSVTWTTGDGGAPSLSFGAPLDVSASVSRVISPGDGATLADGDAIKIGYTVTSGDDGTLLYSTFTADPAFETDTLTSASLDPTFYNAMVGNKVGVQFLYAAQSTDVSPTTGNAVTYIYAVTVLGATSPLERATGTAVAPVAGLPAVALAADGTPSAVIPATDPPTQLVSQTLIEGSGPAVHEGQAIVANYSGWLWADGTQFDSSWASGAPVAFPLTPSGLIEGWVKGLDGVKVGSQVLLILPPDLAYGASGSGSIPANATLVFVIDILGVM